MMRVPRRLTIGTFFASAICGTALASFATPACPTPQAINLQLQSLKKDGIALAPPSFQTGHVISSPAGDPNTASAVVFDPDTSAARTVDLRRMP